jgi:hypothetical protein
MGFGVFPAQPIREPGIQYLFRLCRNAAQFWHAEALDQAGSSLTQAFLLGQPS